MLWGDSQKALFRVLNLSAGVESSVMYLMAVRGDITPCPEFAVFADTGWESKATYDHLNWLDAEFGTEIPIYRVSKLNLKQHILNGAKDQTLRVATAPFWVQGKDGRESRIARWCTREAKLDAIRSFVRGRLAEWVGRENYYPEGAVEQWIGLAADEVVRIKSSGVQYIDHRYPLIELRKTQKDCVRWLQSNGYPVPPHSGCIGCPHRTDAEWREMKDQRPAEFAEAVDFDNAIRGGFRALNSEVYLHRSLKPLGEVEFSLPILQPSLFSSDWAEECSGVCHV